MKITEPMTMITDYLISIVTIVLAGLLMVHTTIDQNKGGWLLALALIITGIGAIFGGSSHGFKEILSERQDELLWKATTLTIGVAAFLFLQASIITSIIDPTLQVILIIFGILQLGIYTYWMLGHDEFIYVIINYVVAMISVIILKSFSFLLYDDPSSLWLIGGVLISFLASGIQAAEIGIHDKYFNHNDLFHVVQLPGFYLMYLAGLAMVGL